MGISARRHTAVHPRARGEHELNAFGTKEMTVHPRARGEHPQFLAHHDQQSRFIPALAIVCSSSFQRSVHPRARGEHDSTHDIGWVTPYVRFIPALAGNI